MNFDILGKPLNIVFVSHYCFPVIILLHLTTVFSEIPVPIKTLSIGCRLMSQSNVYFATFSILRWIFLLPQILAVMI